MAFIVSKDTGYTIEEVIWNLPIQMVSRLISLSYSMSTGKTTRTRGEKMMLREKMKILEREAGNAQA